MMMITEHEDKKEDKIEVTPELELLSKTVSNDPGVWPSVFTEEMRSLWIQKGPEYFQNKNSDFSKSTRRYEEANGKIKMRNLSK